MISNLLNGILSLPLWLQMVLYVVLIVGGMFALIKGADAFVDGASGIAKRLKIPAIIIGLTIVSIGTSLPEASVSISSAITGSADISIGNVVGSNMFNTLVVLGFALVFVPIVLNKKIIFKDILLMLLCSILLLIFALFGGGESGYILSRVECAILFAIFVGYIVFSVIDAKRSNKMQSVESAESQAGLQNQNLNANLQKVEFRQTENDCIDYDSVANENDVNEIVANDNDKTENVANMNADDVKESKQNESASNVKTSAKNSEKGAEMVQSGNGEMKESLLKNIVYLVIGLLGIIIGGDFVVFGAKNFALQIGMSEVLVGLTIVAIGTSLPELVTSIVAARKGENDIALGNVIGSNLFNIVFILGLTGIISPLVVASNVLIDIIIMTVLFVLLFVFSVIKKKLPKYLGYIMLGIYVVYLTYIILRDFVFLT
ncbi:MAG: calcium/sodium antiporter [Christensenellales bacterium]